MAHHECHHRTRIRQGAQRQHNKRGPGLNNHRQFSTTTSKFIHVILTTFPPITRQFFTPQQPSTCSTTPLSTFTRSHTLSHQPKHTPKHTLTSGTISNSLIVSSIGRSLDGARSADCTEASQLLQS